MTVLRPAELHRGGGTTPASPAAREERLQTLYARWEQFAGEFHAAHEVNDQEVMTNLRGLLLLIKKEIVKLGGKTPEFPIHGDFHLADL